MPTSDVCTDDETRNEGDILRAPWSRRVLLRIGILEQPAGGGFFFFGPLASPRLAVSGTGFLGDYPVRPVTTNAWVLEATGTRELLGRLTILRGWGGGQGVE
jgi:hypothetical protein